MKRAAIYSRFSDEQLQSDKSVDDQIALCRARAERDGYRVVATYADRGISGASMFNRPEVRRMLADAKGGKFDVVLLESLDRLSRDQEDTAHVYKRLTFANVELLTVDQGRTDQVQIGVRGIVSALFLTDLANKVRRGAAGNIRQGKHAGGLAYGYNTTPGRPGEWVVNEGQAGVIRRIFTEYVAGDRPRQICARLNSEGVPPPRGRYWQAGALTGSNNRHNGILGSEVYAGQLVWNRVRMVKDPETGRRVSRPNPESEWHRVAVAHLRIVDDEVFNAAQALRKTRANAAPVLRRKPKHMLSGLLKCSACGGGVSVRGRDRGGTRLVCTAHQAGKGCDHSRTYYLHHVEEAVLSGLREQLRDPKAIRHFLKTYHDERKRLAADGDNQRSVLDRRLGELRRKIERATAAMLESDEAVSKFTKIIDGLEVECQQAESALAALAAPVKVVSLHPAAQERYLRVVDRLAKSINEREPGNEMAEAVRELVETVTIEAPAAAGDPLKVSVRGRLAVLCEAPIFPDRNLSGVKMVAGARYGVDPNINTLAFSYTYEGPPIHANGIRMQRH